MQLRSAIHLSHNPSPKLTQTTPLSYASFNPPVSSYYPHWNALYFFFILYYEQIAQFRCLRFRFPYELLQISLLESTEHAFYIVNTHIYSYH